MDKVGITDTSMYGLNQETCCKCGAFITPENKYKKRADNECDITEYPMGLCICKQCIKK